MKDTEEQKKDKVDKPQAHSGKKGSSVRGGSKAKAAKEIKEPAPGSRKSARLGDKRSAHDSERGNAEDNGAGEEDIVAGKALKKKKPAKK